MKFIGTPNQLIRLAYRIGLERKTKSIGRFDHNGIFKTEDTKIINRMKKYFKSEETEEPKIEILRHCKKCSFTCATQGELLRHYREEHPKGEQYVTE